MFNRKRISLIWAINHGNFEDVELLIKKDVDVNEIDVRGNTALHLAAVRCNPEIVKLLLDNGANVHAKTPDDGWTPLHATIPLHPLFKLNQVNEELYLKNKYEIVKLLLDNGAYANEKDRHGITPLSLAKIEVREDKRMQEVLKLLMEYDIDLESNGFRGIKWGTEINNLKDMQYLGTDSLYGEVKFYKKKNENSLIWEGVEIEGVMYRFWRDKFYEARIYVEFHIGFLELKTAAFEKFGQLPYNNEGIYTWTAKFGTDIMLNFDWDDQIGKLCIVSNEIQKQKDLAEKLSRFLSKSSGRLHPGKM